MPGMDNDIQPPTEPSPASTLALRKAAEALADLTERALVMVTHGKPTVLQAEAAIAELRAALKVKPLEELDANEMFYRGILAGKEFERGVHEESLTEVRRVGRMHAHARHAAIHRQRGFPLWPEEKLR